MEIPESLWSAIFKRLPVNIICRLSIVCKSWNSIIKSAFFITAHHSFTTTILSSTPANLRSKLESDGKFLRGSYSIYYPARNIRRDLYFPFRLPEDRRSYLCFTQIDVIYGIVCISYGSSSSFDSTILWNPAIHKYVVLPRLNIPFPEYSCIYHPYMPRNFCHGIGFGYDASNNDFKVVRIWMVNSYMKPYHKQSSVSISIPINTCEVYSTRDGLWRPRKVARDFQCCLYNFQRRRTGCFVNGTIHWLVNSKDSAEICVLMFDCELEEFTTMKIPRELYSDNGTMGTTSTKLELLRYDGKLLALVHRNNMGHIAIWVMEEHGLPCTWKKLYEYENDHNLSFMNHHIYEESMFLMDDPNAKSYAELELVFVG